MQRLNLALWALYFLNIQILRSQSTTTSFGDGTNSFSIDFISIGNPANSADTTGFGRVNYSYKISKFEITVSQYIKFLNSKAKSHNSLIWDDTCGALGFIERNGVNGSYNYSIRWNGGNMPITSVSWFDAARYCNWLHNGATELSSMETGAYNLNGSTNTVVTKSQGAKYWIPSEDEWYKAAYYDPDYDKMWGGGDGYYEFATRSHSITTNSVTYKRGGDSFYTLNIPYTGTTYVGTYTNYPSYYGTFDQSGNVGEWTDSITNTSSSTLKYERGGWWSNEFEYVMSKLNRNSRDPSQRSGYLGIRLAAQVELTQNEASEWSFISLGSTIQITEYLGTNKNISIPSQINGIPVTKVGNPTYAKSIFGSYWGPNGLVPNTSIVSVTLPSTITNIGAYSFIGLTSVTNLALPSSVRTIEDGAFQHMQSMNAIDLMYGLENLGSGAFIDCPSLVEINIPDSVTTMGHSMFQLCTSLVNVSLSEKLLSISDNPFSNCSNLKSVFFRGDLPLAAGSWTDFSATIYCLESAVGWSNNFAGRQVYKIPSVYNKTQFASNRTNGVNDVINSPNSYNLYTTNQIHNLGLGGIMLNRNTNNQLVLNYQVLHSTDLHNWSPYQQYVLPITNAPSDKMFLRVQAVGP